ncbi:hypothetical protein D9M69_360570 [compost metagenome]
MHLVGLARRLRPGFQRRRRPAGSGSSAGQQGRGQAQRGRGDVGADHQHVEVRGRRRWRSGGLGPGRRRRSWGLGQAARRLGDGPLAEQRRGHRPSQCRRGGRATWPRCVAGHLGDDLRRLRRHRRGDGGGGGGRAAHGQRQRHIRCRAADGDRLRRQHRWRGRQRIDRRQALGRRLVGQAGGGVQGGAALTAGLRGEPPEQPAHGATRAR